MAESPPDIQLPGDDDPRKPWEAPGLMANRVLRDQCKHGRYEPHRIVVPAAADGWVKTEPCSGGQEVTIDHEAAEQEAGRWNRRAVDVRIPMVAVQAILVAALGVSDA